MAFLTEKVSDSLFNAAGEPLPSYDITTKKFGASSIQFAGNTGYIYKSSSNLDLSGLSNFTVSLWVLATNYTDKKIPMLDFSNYWGLRLRDNSLELYKNGGGGLVYRNPANGYFSTSNWNHVAAVKSGTTYRLFVNGVLLATRADSYSFPNTTQTLRIGRDNNGYATCKLDEIIITNTAEWSENFDVPTQALGSVESKHIFVMQFNQTFYKIMGTTTEDSRVMVFDESDFSLEENTTVTEGNYEVSLGDGYKTVIMVPNDGTKNGKIYRGVHTVEI